MSTRQRYTILITAMCAGMTTFLVIGAIDVAEARAMLLHQFAICAGVAATVMGALYSRLP